MWVYGLILFGLFLLCNKQSTKKKIDEAIKRNDNDPRSTIKSDKWYREHPNERRGI